MSCADCAWFSTGCIATTAYGEPPAPRLATDPRCERFEPKLNCHTCGACCREAFDAVPAEGSSLPLEYIEQWSEDFAIIARVPQAVGSRCACLHGDGVAQRYRCTHYDQRATACRELLAGSENCLLARRRVGLSPMERSSRLEE